MDYFIADPAGNTTAFVLGQPNAHTAEKLLSDSELKIEQVAFLGPPQQGGHIKCDMAGGEFCGNACRAAGYYYGLKHGLPDDSDVLVEMSGTEGKTVKVTVYPESGRSFVNMPLPQRVSEVELSGRQLPVVLFDGIAHIIAPYELRDAIDLNKELMHRLCRQLDTAALGIMFLSGDAQHLKPVVWVDQVGSLIWESSCGSGSAACAWWLSNDLQDGKRDFVFTEPGGVLEVTLLRNRAGDSELCPPV